MARSRQSEHQRSGHAEADPEHAEENTSERTPGGRAGQDGGELGPVPPANQPGQHGRHGVDQDKPDRPPPQPRSSTSEARVGKPQRFPFLFDPRMLPMSAAAGVLPMTAYVEVDDTDLSIRFGPWSLRTPRTNVRNVEPTGPYRWWKVAGPPHLSLSDRGVTFATTTVGGLCICFHEPVPALLPTGLLRHPAATVTVAAPHSLADALDATG
jgi:hypothetical protein